MFALKPNYIFIFDSEILKKHNLHFFKDKNNFQNWYFIYIHLLSF